MKLQELVDMGPQYTAFIIKPGDRLDEKLAEMDIERGKNPDDPYSSAYNVIDSSEDIKDGSIKESAIVISDDTDDAMECIVHNAINDRQAVYRLSELD